MKKIKMFAKETNATVLKNSLRWHGPPKAPENGLTIPFSDLGRTTNGGIFRISMHPSQKNTLIE